MPNGEIELDPVDYITVSTIDLGQAPFSLQAGRVTGSSRSLSKGASASQRCAIAEQPGEASPEAAPVNLARWDMSLRDPIEPLFRVAQMGLGYDESRDLVVVVAHELVTTESGDIDPDLEPQVVRLWGTREQMRALSQYAQQVVKQGRADPKTNGRLINYWT